MNCSMPGSHVLHYLPEFVQIHVYWVRDDILTISSSVVPLSSHPQSFPAYGSFRWVGALRQVAKISELHRHNFKGGCFVEESSCLAIYWICNYLFLIFSICRLQPQILSVHQLLDSSQPLGGSHYDLHFTQEGTLEGLCGSSWGHVVSYSPEDQVFWCALIALLNLSPCLSWGSERHS